ncbi:MAG: hypothetical protein KGQ46_13895 [Hyphomicrobiales bacterium]|nr:hypothetical protein [Hyphomicrobiales bacterium]
MARWLDGNRVGRSETIEAELGASSIQKLVRLGEKGAVVGSRGKRIRHQIDLGSADYALLTDAARVFGLDRSEVMRRLLRGAMQVGPAMSDANDQQFATTAKALRAVKLELVRMLQAVRVGEVVGMEDSEAVWQEVFNQTEILDNEMAAIILSYGIRLRAAADLAPSGGMV